ncbi:hypothetical protein Tco_0384933 [Tanacetum coccineum]
MDENLVALTLRKDKWVYGYMRGQSKPEEAPLEADELQPLGSRVPLMDEEFEASEPLGTRTISSYSLASLNSTTPLSPNHPLTQALPIPTPTELHSTIQSSVRDLDTEKEGSEDESSDSGEEEEDAAPEGQQQAVPVEDTTMDEPLGLRYRALRRRELALGEGLVPSTFEIGQSSRSMSEHEGAERVSAFRQPTLVTWVDPEDGRVDTDILTYVPPVAPVQTPPSLEWSSGSLPVLPSSPLVPLPIASPATTPAATISVDEDQFLEVGA